MSDNKRAPLISLGAPKESDRPSKQPRKTVRIRVQLPESTEDTCPEFSYKDELAAAKKRLRGKEVENKTPPNGLRPVDDPDDNDDDVRRIARQMEEKYGAGVSATTKKRKGRKDDYADIGMGYDESDPFIDNTDGYDEVIPQNVTTLHGGFYINSGALEFKADGEANSDFSSSSSDDDETPKKKTASRRNIIESSDETDGDSKTESNSENPKKRKMVNSGNGIQPALKKKYVDQSNNKIYIKKRRPLDPLKKTVKELLREKRVDLNMTVPTDASMIVEDNENSDTDKKGHVSSNVSITIESVVKATSSNHQNTNVNLNKSDVDVVVIRDEEDEAEGVVAEEKYKKLPPVAATSTPTNVEFSSSHEQSAKDVKLPENLSAEIVSVISSIKSAAKFSPERKVSFSPELDGLILKLEKKSKCLGKPSKMKVYEHLAAFLRCRIEKLTRRAKNLVLEDEQTRLQNLLSGLQLEINKIMPSLLDSHEKESQKVLQKKFSHDSLENEENKQLRMPKRRFQWNDSTKKYVKDILMIKKRCLLLEGRSKDDLDNPMIAFLKSKIQVLWPEGWMSMNALNKIYTTYADPKRVLNSSGSSNNMPQPQSFNNSNVSIMPVTVDNKEPSSSLSVNVKKSLPEPPPSCDIIAEPLRKESGVENIVNIGKLKVKSQSELLSNNSSCSNNSNKDGSVIIIDGPVKTVKTQAQPTSDNSYCQVIDLSDKNDFNKTKSDSRRDFELVGKETTITPVVVPAANPALTAVKHELSITPTYAPENSIASSSTKTSDDIQKVMEDLKVLQNMSSPKKSLDSSPSSSAVSVIAVNKNYASKPAHQQASRVDYHKTDYTTSFQDEFQKQLMQAFNNIPPAKTSKSYNSSRYAPSGGAGMVAVDKYYQNSNNNYAQSSNGHKSCTSTNQTGTYSILDDMLANLFTQYGYSKEAATAPKSQQQK